MTDTLRDRIAAAIGEARREWMRPGSDAGQTPFTDHLAAAVLPLVAAELRAAADELTADASALDALSGPLENNYARGMREAADRLHTRADAEDGGR